MGRKTYSILSKITETPLIAPAKLPEINTDALPLYVALRTGKKDPKVLTEDEKKMVRRYIQQKTDYEQQKEQSEKIAEQNAWKNRKTITNLWRGITGLVIILPFGYKLIKRLTKKEIVA
ncbi:MAG: hypothetical protein ACYC21_15645 [Eubacteriales bacterium]